MTVLRQVPVLLFLSLLAFVTVRAQIQDDHRYGFSMFRTFTGYYLQYQWILEDGSEIAHTPEGAWMLGKARKMKPAKPQKPKHTISGNGTVRNRAWTYMKWVYAHHKPKRAVAIKADMGFQQWDVGEWRTDSLTYPAP